MFAVDQDFESHPLGRALPALQRFQRLSGGLKAAQSSEDAARTCTPELLAYLSEQCTNITHVLTVKQLLERCKASHDALEAVDAAEAAVEARAQSLRTATAQTVAQYTAQGEEVLAKLRETDFSLATTSAALEHHFIGVPGATACALPAGGRPAGSGDPAHNPNLSCVWCLGEETAPSAANCLVLAPVTPTASLAASKSASLTSYVLHGLSSAMAVAAPYVVQLQSIALLTGSASEAAEVVMTCSVNLNTHLNHDDGRRPFVMLEVLRHYVIIALGEGPAGARSAVARLGSELSDAAAYIGVIDSGIKEARARQQFPGALIALREAAAKVLRDYSVFFHLVMTTLESTSGANFVSIATALDFRNGAVFGIFRFPFLAPLLLASHAHGRAQRRQVRDPTNATNISVVVGPTEAAGGAGSNKEAVVGTVAPFTSTVMPVVVNALMPAPGFATLAVLSSLATVPMAEVLTLHVAVTEMAMMAESAPTLVELLRALRKGDWGGVYSSACKAAHLHLASELLVSPDGARALMCDVRSAVCFQYLRVRSSVTIERAAEALHLPGGAKELTLVVERLIQEGKLSARINGVTGVIRHVVPPTTTDPKFVLMEAVVACEANVREVEQQLRVLSATRCFGTPSINSTDSVFWAQTRRQDR